MAALGALCVLGSTIPATAAASVNAVQLVPSSLAAADAAPAAQTVTISQAGSYTVTLTDLQLPTALASLNLAIVNSTTSEVSLSAAGTQTVTLAAGTYTAQVLAVAATGAIGGTFSVQLTPAGGGPVAWQYEGTVGPANSAPNTGQSALSAQITASAPGTYQLTATDLAFPTALSSFNVGVFVHCGTTPGCTPTAIYTSPASNALPYSYSAPLTLAAGTYDLFIVAANKSALQGLYSIQITGGGTTLYSATEAVGELPAASSITVAAGGSVSLKLVDLGAALTSGSTQASTPIPALTSFKAIVAQGGTVLQQAASAGTSTFAAAAGTLQLYVAATPGSGGQGAYEAYFTSGSQALADIAQPVLATNSYGYEFSTTLATAGSYQVSVNDFQKPVPLSSLTAVTAQQGSPTAATQTGTTFTAQPGLLNVLVFPTVASSTSTGLFGVTITGPGSSAIVYQTTQGVGALFSSQTVTVTTAGSYDLNLVDFMFPASFTNLALIATSGDTVVGSIFSAGQLKLNLTAGTYVLSVLAQVGLNANYGMYGLNLAPAPAAPTVTLTSSASSVASGKSATLTWSSTDATSCTASGGWNGTLATSGSQSTGALTESSSFTLTCTGGGGTGTATVQVAVNNPAASSHGGGGAFSPALLLAFLVFLFWTLWRRRTGAQAQGGTA